MGRIEEIINYANSYKGKGVEIEELKDIIKLAIIDGAIWADANPKWKPSDEQMHYLSWIANVNLGDSLVEQEVSKHLNELLEDLKKLREG